MAIYHVTREWDGGDLKPLAQRVDDGEMGAVDDVLEMLAAKWTDGCLRAAERYLDSVDARQVHCHATLAEAVDFLDEFFGGEGQVLMIDDSGLELAVGSEYPHPAIVGSVPAGLISVVEREAA